MPGFYPDFQVGVWKKQKRINLQKWKNLIINMKNYNAFALEVQGAGFVIWQNYYNFAALIIMYILVRTKCSG
ncbi:MAG: hypothetical protein DRI73_02130 [Bacteroidetes bacterium]|nr:MAG: hypothetical protein DRI73_02130 [Bacteroidota bacterium]